MHQESLTSLAFYGFELGDIYHDPKFKLYGSLTSPVVNLKIRDLLSS